MLGEKHGGLNHFTECPVGGQVLFSGASMGWNHWRHCRVARV